MKTALTFMMLGLLAAAVLAGGGTVAAQTHQSAQTYFLVAQPDLPDPMFRQSVVLMLPPTGTELVVGLIVNKPTKVKLSDLYPDDAALKRNSGTAFFGGPVGINAPLMLIRAKQAPAAAVHLFEDIYLDFKPHSALSGLKDPQSLQGVRLYLGRAQWTDDQLHNEMLENSWYQVPSDPQYVFSADPDTVWRNLVARAQAIETAAPRAPARGVLPGLLQVTWPSVSALDETILDR
jgi:putative transcriptional regulator